MAGLISIYNALSGNVKMLQHFHIARTCCGRLPTELQHFPEESSTKNVFSNFSGFGKTSPGSQSTPGSPFAFLSTLQNNTPVKTNGLSSFSSNNSSPSTLIFKPSTTPTFKSPQSTNPSDNIKQPENGTSSTPTNTLIQNSPVLDKNHIIDKKSTDYYANLKGLNESVSRWIKTHVDKNPFCILTPIFRDYEKYLKEIESKKDIESEKSKTETKNTDTNKITKLPFSTTSVTPASSIFGQLFSKPPETSMFASKSTTIPEHNSITDTSPFASKPITFGSTTSAPSTGFSFGTGTPFSFANVAKPPSEKKSIEENAETEDEPPKVEFTPVVEDDNIFSKRCKVFVKKDGNFGDRGVGTLFLKPVSGSDKVQLIVRADTNLGNLLLNFILSETIPLQRMGKNNVMLVCVPLPDSKPPPVPVLLRVKTAEEADELLKVLEKNKK